MPRERKKIGRAKVSKLGPNLYSELREATRAYMSAQGVTQVQLAGTLGVTQQVVSAFLGGSTTMSAAPEGSTPGDTLGVLVGLLRKAKLY